MKKFRFRLQTLLRLRQQQQDQKQRRVGSLLDRIQIEQNQALQMAQGLSREGEQLRHQYAKGRIDLTWIAQYRRYVTATQNAINERVRRVGHIQTELHGARQELAEAAKHTRILETLRERQLQRHNHALARFEAAELDDIATRTYTRKMHEQLT